jgi:hypothetical protein
MPDMIEYGVVGTRPGTDYVTWGLVVTYRAGGATRSAVLYNGGDACVLDVKLSNNAARERLYRRYCAAADSRAENALFTVAARGPG